MALSSTPTAADPATVLTLTTQHWHTVATIADTIHHLHGRHAFTIIEDAARAMTCTLAPRVTTAAESAASDDARVAMIDLGYNLSILRGQLTTDSATGTVAVEFEAAPGLSVVRSRIGLGLAVDALDAFWCGAAAGLTDALGGMTVSVTPAARSPWAIRFRPDTANPLLRPVPVQFGDPDLDTRVMRLGLTFVAHARQAVAALAASE